MKLVSTTTAADAARTGAAICLSALALLLGPLATGAQADRTIAEFGEGAGQVSEARGLAVDSETGRLYVADSGNRRISAFDAEGDFEFAWGWGVADGSPEAQTCGPKATPPTATCLKGIPGGGAGQFAGGFAGIYDIAVDNDPVSPSHRAVYALDSLGTVGGSHSPNRTRVQKFDPEGSFLLTFGAGVVDGGAEGAGDLSEGSSTVSNVTTTKKAFAVNQTIAGAGIPAATKILAMGEGTLTLSKAATATAAGAALSVAEGPGNVPVDEVQELRQSSGTLFGWGVGFISPPPDGVGALTGGRGEGLLHPESTSVTEVSTDAGIFFPGQQVSCCGGGGPSRPFYEDPPYLIVFFDPEAGAMTLSKPTNPVVPSGKVEIRGRLPENASAAFVQTALEALPNLEPGDIEVSGPDGGPYLVEFKGPRFSDTNVEEIRGENSAGNIGGAVAVGAPHGASGAEICTVANAWSCRGGIEGTGEGQFARAAVLAIGPGGTVHVADSVFVPGENHHENRLQRFGPDGGFLEQIALPGSDKLVAGLAVGAGGELYLTIRGELNSAVIRKYDSAGVLLEAGAAPFATALASGVDEHLFSGERDGNFAAIAQRDGEGEVVRRFGYESLGSQVTEWSRIAPHQSPGGDIYAALGNSVVHLSYPPPGPIAPKACEAKPLGNTKATLNSQVNPAGKPTTFHYEYVDQQSYEEDGFAGPNTKVSPESEPLGSDHVLHAAAQQVSVLPETTYRCRVVAANEDDQTTGPEGVFTTLPPFEILAAWSSAVGSEEAMLSASVNPLGSPVSGFFEYVDRATFEESGFAFAERAPLAPGELDFGAGESPQVDSAGLEGLEPATEYRYRLAVDAHVIPIRYGETRGFRTRPPGPAAAPDGRRYELVSPAQKNSAEVAAPNNAGGGGAILAASADGEAVAYGSFSAFADPESAPAPSQYLSRRGASSWSTRSLSLPGRLSRQITPYQGFTADLRYMAAISYEPPLTGDCPAGVEALYRRDTASGAIVCLIPGNAPPTSGTFCPVYSGASVDGSEVIFAANGRLAGAPPGSGFHLYRWSEGEGVSFLSVLPSGAPAPPRSGTGFGAASYAASLCRSQGNLDKAISADGQRAFWTFDGEFEESPKPLLASSKGGATVRLDAPQGVAVEEGEEEPKGGEGKFLAAAKDGSAVLFSTPRKLTPDWSGGVDLYRYDFSAPEGERLTDLTPGSLTPEPEEGEKPQAAGFLGVLDASEDATAAYFTATGVLSGEEENAFGTKAEAGQPNLYLWRLGEGVRFLATLSSGDSLNWSTNPATRTARASAGGEALAFTSALPLTGYDNAAQGTGQAQRQVFLYDGGADLLSCASCNPTGQRPTGAASLPAWSSPFQGPRYLSVDGRRLFFETADGLLASDQNGARDVYEFERPGSGTCTEQVPEYIDAQGGCLYLISGGAGEEGSFLIDASADGDDVFFSTRERLLAADGDERYDVYNYRVEGFPEPPPMPPLCAGEACKGSLPPPPPPAGAPGTAAFQGPGNPRQARPQPRRCPKGKRKVRRAGQVRCVNRPRRCPKGKRKVRRAGQVRCVNRRKAPAAKRDNRVHRRMRSANHDRGASR